MNDKRQGVLLEWMLDKIEKNGRVDGSSFFCVFECEVQVGTSTATTVACQRVMMPGRTWVPLVTRVWERWQ